MKAGLDGYAFSKQILQEIGKNKRFAKWLMKNRAELSRNDYNVDVIKASFRTGRPLAELQNIRKNQQALKKAVGISELRTFFKNDLEKFVTYLATQKTSVYSYNDYFRACNYLGLNMTEDNRFTSLKIVHINFSKLLKKENTFKDSALSISDKNDSKISITNENISDFLCFMILFWTSMRSSILSMNPDIFCCSSMVGYAIEIFFNSSACK